VVGAENRAGRRSRCGPTWERRCGKWVARAPCEVRQRPLDGSDFLMEVARNFGPRDGNGYPKPEYPTGITR
jgi:hypothetical protein